MNRTIGAVGSVGIVLVVVTACGNSSGDISDTVSSDAPVVMATTPDIATTTFTPENGLHLMTCDLGGYYLEVGWQDPDRKPSVCAGYPVVANDLDLADFMRIHPGVYLTCEAGEASVMADLNHQTQARDYCDANPYHSKGN